jgi:hypothetical protein
MFIPDPGSDFYHPGFRVDNIPDPRSGSATKNWIWFFFHPGSRGQKAPDPGSGFATLVDLHRVAVSRHELLNEPSLFCSLSRISLQITKNIPYCNAYLVHETQR